jgi:hypothetical protein
MSSLPETWNGALGREGITIPSVGKGGIGGATKVQGAEQRRTARADDMVMSSLPSDPRTMTQHRPYPRHGFDLGREATALASLHLIELSRDGESWCGRTMTPHRPYLIIYRAR